MWVHSFCSQSESINPPTLPNHPHIMNHVLVVNYLYLVSLVRFCSVSSIPDNCCTQVLQILLHSEFPGWHKDQVLVPNFLQSFWIVWTIRYSSLVCQRCPSSKAQQILDYPSNLGRLEIHWCPIFDWIIVHLPRQFDSALTQYSSSMNRTSENCTNPSHNDNRTYFNAEISRIVLVMPTFEVVLHNKLKSVPSPRISSAHFISSLLPACALMILPIIIPALSLSKLLDKSNKFKDWQDCRGSDNNYKCWSVRLQLVMINSLSVVVFLRPNDND